MAKKVKYKGEQYKVRFTSYGYSHSRFIINGENSSEYIDNSNINDSTVFKRIVKKAIEEYIQRNEARKQFDAWDGSL